LIATLSRTKVLIMKKIITLFLTLILLGSWMNVYTQCPLNVSITSVPANHTVCIGQPIQLTANATGGTGNYTYLWTSGNETTQTINPTPPLGNTTYSVTVTDNTNPICTGSAFVTVTVYPIPVPTISGNTNVCAGTSTIYSTEAGMSGYNWNVPTGGTITGGLSTQTITVLWNTAGSHTVTVSYSSNGCPAAVPTTLPITVLSYTTPAITGSNSICQGALTTYSTQAGMSAYNWSVSGAGGSITTSQNTNQITVLWSQYGTGTVSVNYTNSNGCRAPMPSSYSVIVNRLPDATLYDPNDQIEFTNCNNGATFTLTVQYNPAYSTNNSSYTIDWGDLTPIWSNAAFPPAGVTHTYTSLDSYSLVFIVTTSDGCSNSTTYNVYNGSNPALGITNPIGTQGCIGISLTWEVSGTSGNTPATMYYFDFGDGTIIGPLSSAPPTVTHQYNTASCALSGATFQFHAWAINPCGRSDHTFTPIYISKPPVALFTSTSNYYCINSSVSFTNTTTAGCNIATNGAVNNNTNFTWDFGDGITQVINNVTPATIGTTGSPNPHTYSAAGTYIVTLTATNWGSTACGNTIFTKSITINPLGQVNPVGNQVVCNNSATAQVVFLTTNPNPTTTYAWANDKPSIGLAASGSGNISSFTAINAGITPVTATITVTPTYANGGTSCPGPPKTFTITVNPTAQVNLPTSQTVCNNGSTAAVTFTTNNTGGTTTYSWTNDTPGIGLAASGTGNIASFTAINTGTGPVVATIIVTPKFTNGSVDCSGPAKTFTITVNPTGQVIQPTDVFVCSGSQATVTFVTTNTGAGTTTFAWTNNTVSIGLGASGSGNIAFTASNTGSSPVVAMITVTPTYTNGTPGCPGPPKTFYITVNPSGQVNMPAPQVVCNGAGTTAVTFTTNNTGGTTTYAWANNTTSIGLAANGSGDIPSFTAFNNGTSPVTATITVTPTLTNGSVVCIGSSKSFSVTVNPTGQVNTPNSPVVCNGVSTSVIFVSVNTGGLNSYAWTNSATSIGLGASGSGNISFTATNTGTAPVVANIVVTPNFNNGGVNCSGLTKSSTITVNPSGQVDLPANQVICNGGSTTAITFTTSNTGGTTTYAWTNDKTSIGLAANGSGNIASFTAINGGTAPVTATITVTPTYTNGGTSCTGTPKIFTITVNPTGQVNLPVSQTVCNNGSTAAITFTTNNTGGITTYSWTNDTPGIGLAASGTGNIPSFTAINTGTAPVVASIVVTPTYTNGLVDCIGTSRTFSITVNPTGQVVQPSDQIVCAGIVTTVTFSTDNTSGATTYGWTNTNSTVGLALNGSGNISFTAANSTTVPVVATITVTPTFSNGGTNCQGPSKIFTITVNPNGQVNQPANQVICHNASTTQVIFTTNNSTGSTTYSWTNTTPSIGLAASGNGNIAAFTTINTGASPVIASIVVTPTTINSGLSCIGTPKTFTITVNPLPTPSISGPGEVCENATGNIYTTQTGMANYTWSVSAGGLITAGGTVTSNTATIKWITPGPQNISVTYSLSGCSAESPTTYNITVNPSPTSNAGLDQLIPYGTSTTITGIPGGGTPGYTYIWTPAAGINGSNTGLTATTTNITVNPTYYTFTVNDSKGCSISDQVKISLNGGPLSVVATATPNPICNNGTTVQLNASASGGNSAYSISYSWVSNPAGSPVWSSSLQNPVVTPTVTTIYTVTVYDLFNTASNPVTVTVNPLPTAFNVTGGGEYCAGGTGMVVGLSGSQSGVTYQCYKDGVADGSPVTGNGIAISFGVKTAAGTYTAKATYTSTLCQNDMSGNVTIIINPLPVANAGVDKSISYGTSTTLSGTASGGTGTLGYSWTPIAYITANGSTLTPTTTNLFAATTFTLLVTDIKGCSASDPMTVSLTGNALSVSASASPNVICNNGASVQLGATATGGSGTYTYSWASVPVGFASILQNPIVTPIVSTAYTVTVNDGFNNASNTVSVTVNPLPTVFSMTGGGEYCAGGTGKVVGLSGSQAGVNYQCYKDGVADGSPVPGNNSAISFGIKTAAGTYTAKGTNSTTTCQNDMSGSVTVVINPLPVANAGVDKSIPYGTNTTLSGTASGGTGTLGYSWTPVVSIASNGTTLTPTTTNIYASTTFILTVTDIKGCSASDAMTVNLNGNPLSVTATATPNVICNNGASVQLGATAAGGSGTYTYSWTSLPVGFTSTIVNPVASPTVTTVYTITVNDGYNTTSNPVTVTVNPLPTVYNMTGGGEYCAGGLGQPVGLSGSQTGISYQCYKGGVADGSPVIGTGSAISFGNKTMAGTYTAKATNITTTCWSNMNNTSVISVNPLPVVEAGSDKIIPHGTSTTLSGAASGGTGTLAYNWTPVASIASGQTTLSPTTTNIYLTTKFLLTVTDAKTCINKDSMQVILNGNPLDVIATVNPGTICFSESVQLTATGSGGSGTYTYSWVSIPAGIPPWTSNQQNPLVFPDISARYRVTVNDGYNTDTASVYVVVNPLPVTYQVTGGGSYCFGGNGMPVGLSNSQNLVAYQLFRNGTGIGSPLNGTGSALSFGNQSVAGIYKIKATRPSTGCNAWMNDSATVVILPLPDAFTVTGGGSYPAGGIGVEIGLNGSQIGVFYRLVHGSDTLTPAPGLAGTGTAISFGYQTLAGQYTVVAKFQSTPCSKEMLGNANIIINPYPSAFNMFGGGPICLGEPGKMVGLDGSEIGVRYILRRNIDSIAGLLGTGDSLFFGIFNIAGTYTVKGVNLQTGLQKLMNGSAVIIINPLPVAYLMVPQRDTCPGTEVLINGSQFGINYYLLKGNDTVTMRTGTGLFGLLSFGNQYDTGIYRVVAINPLTGCIMDQIGTVVILPAPLVYNVIPPGILCPGQIITLTGSQIGINYQLRRDSLINVGNAVPGTGSGLSFGPQFLPGVYRVIAINPLTHCYTWQNGNATIQPGPVIYTIIPNGDTCAGGRVRLNGSQTGIYYHLILNNTVYLDSLYGTGQPLVFGTYTTTGTYMVLAVDTLTHCERWMDGQVNVFARPIEYNITPNGIACAGEIVGLDASELGVNYTLLRDNWIIAGGPIPGTGFPISFGIQNATGNYTIEAKIPATGCSRIMSGVASLYPRPLSFILMPQGNHCAGTDIFLNGSQTGVNYQLLRDGMVQQTKPGTGTMIHFGFQFIAGVYTIKAVNTFSTCDTLMSGSDTIIAGPLAFDLTPAGANCSPTTIGLTGSEINVIYQLIKNGAAVGSPLPGTGNSLSFGLQTNGIYRIVATSIITSCADTMAGIVIITPGPSVFAGNDTTICAMHSVILHANGSNYSTIHWFTSGDGTFSNTSIPNPVYYPGSTDISNGTLLLSAWVYGLPECSSAIAKDTLVLLIHPYPTANAGNNDTICSTQTISLNGIAQFYSSILWRTSGDGHFDNSHILNPVYTPGMSDKTSGQAHLTLTVHGTLQCLADTISDDMLLYIEPLPMANAGNDDTICETMTYRLSGISQHASSVSWTTTGDGSFDNPTILNPYYSPGPTDKIAGNVRLVLTAFGTLHCNSEIRHDTMHLLINRLPIVFAGNDDTICTNQSFSIYATAQRQSSLDWASSGDGTFSNIHSLTSIYYPGPNDKIAGQVWLKLTAWGTLKCIPDNVKDSLLLNILPMPVAYAGPDTLSCPNVPIPLNGSATNFMSVLWASLGDGTFDNNTLLHPHYTSGSADNSQGHVILTMTANGQMQCGSQISTDTVRIDFKPLPNASITGTPLICEGDAATISFSLTGAAPWSVVYTDGTSNFTINNIPASPFSITVHPIVTTTYSILSMNDASCSANLPLPVFTVTVNPKPNTYNMVATNGGAYCEGGIGVEIGIDGSQPGIFYQLLFAGSPNGSPMPGNGSPISFGYKSTPGVYKVRATHPQTLCVSMFPDSIIVIVFPTPAVDFTMDSTCFGTPTQFHINGVDISKIAVWNWNFGDGNSSTYTSPVEPVHTYPAPGNYTVSLSVTDTNGCQKMLVHPIYVSPLPVALFSNNAPLCLGYAVDFTDHSYAQSNSTLRQWHWEFGDGKDTLIIWPGNPNISHLYQNAGTYNVTLTVFSNENCHASIVNTIQVVPSPLANFDHGTSCSKTNVQFTDLSQPNGGGSLVEWAWNFGDPLSGIDNSSTLQNATHLYQTAGNYQVRLIVISSNGCRDTIIKMVQVLQQPKAMFTAGPTCEMNPTQFTDNSIPNANAIIEWDWDFGDGSPHSNLQNPVHLYAVPGQFMVSLWVKNNNQCTHDTVIAVTVIAKPVVLFNSNAPQCVSNPVSYMNLATTQHGQIVIWKWSFGDGTDTTVYFPGVPNVSHVFQGTATQHLVRLTVKTSDSCSNFHEMIINSVPPPSADYSFSSIRCKGQSVNFTDLTQLNGGGTLISWDWNFADPTSGTENTSTLQNPVHIFISAGSYNVRLIVTNLNSCRDTIVHPVSIGESPQAIFTTDTACFGSFTHFTDQSIPNATAIVSWEWNFGDGSPYSHIQNPVHQYATSGIFPVTLTVINTNGCGHSITKQVRVNPAPAAAFSYSQNNCMGSPVVFNDFSTTSQGYIVTWKWYFGDGDSTIVNLPAPQNVTHIYVLAGTYNATLTVITNNGCSNSVTHPVNVAAGPLANFNFASTRCQDSPLSFQDNSQTNGGGVIITWKWDFGDPGSGVNNISYLQNPSHIYSSGGTYQVKLIVININSCSDTTINPVIINSKPSAHYATDTVCKNDTTHFTDLSVAHSGTLVAWNWNFGDGITSTLQNPTHRYAQAGTYNVTLTVQNSLSCQSDTVGQVLVKTPPVALFNHDDACSGSATQFNDLSTTTAGVINQWHWDFGDGDTSNLQNPAHIYANYGIYTVVLTVTNTLHCSASFSLQVSVYVRPNSSFTYYSKYCPKGQVTFTDHSTASGVPIVSWFWTFKPGSNSTDENPTFIYPVTDTTYNVSLVVIDANGCKDTIIQPVNVVHGVSFTFISDSVCFGKTTHFQPLNLAQGDTIHDLNWNFGDPSSGIHNESAAYNPTHQFSGPGTYIVRLSAFNSDDCMDSIFRGVIVYQNPVADFSFDTIPYCDSTVIFHNLSLGNASAIDSLIWIFGDGDTTIQTRPVPPTVTHQYHNFGSFNVHLRSVNSNGCIDNRSKTVLVSCIAASFFDIDTLKCQRQTVLFNDSSGPLSLIRKWYWNFGDGLDTNYTTFKRTIIHKYAAVGDYTVTLVVSMTSNSITLTDTNRLSIHVKSTPIASYSAAPVCFKDSARFINLSDSNGYSIISNYWKFGDSGPGIIDTSSKINPVHLYSRYGKFHSMLVIQNSLGCKDTLKHDIKIYKLPDALFTSPVSCTRQIVFFTDKSKAGDTIITNWFWTFGDKVNNQDSSIKRNPLHTYHQPGRYSVSLKVKDYFGCQDTIRDTLNVLESPLSAFIFTDNVDGISGKLKFTNKSENAEIFYWDFGNGKNSTEENPMVMYEDDGQYVIKLAVKSANTCLDTTSMPYEFIFHGLYVPNLFSPTNMVYQVRLFQPAGINLSAYHIAVYDVAGHTLWESSALDDVGRPLEGWDGTVNGNLMPQGTYMWKISATFKDGKVWEGSNTGKGSTTTMGTVTLVR